MATARRAYFYGVAGVSVQALAWTLISLVGTVLLSLVRGGPPASREVIAFRLALLIVVLPVYVLHWRWLGRAVQRDGRERASAIRGAFLYGVLAMLLAPALVNSHGLATGAWRTTLELLEPSRQPLSGLASVSPAPERLRELAAVLVLGSWWLFHRRVAAEDRTLAGQATLTLALSTTYALAFSAIGLAATAMAAAGLLRVTLHVTGPFPAAWTETLAEWLATLTIGLPLWIGFWRSVRPTEAPADDGRAVLRQIYLYGVVLVGMLLAAGSAANLLAGGARRLVGQRVTSDWRDIAPVLLVAAVAWLYHKHLLDEESAMVGPSTRAAAVRRIYGYMASAVGVACASVGLGGLVALAAEALLSDARHLAVGNQFPWSLALATVGTAVWWPHWRPAQRRAALRDPQATAERRALARKLYLYGCLLGATLALLGGAIYVLGLAILRLLGGQIPTSWAVNLGRALASLALGLAGWAYTALVLREDGAASLTDRLAQQAHWPTLVVDVAPARMAQALIDRLRLELPSLPVRLVTVGAGREDVSAAGGPAARPSLPGGDAAPATDADVRLLVATAPAIAHLLRAAVAGGRLGTGTQVPDAAEASAQGVTAGEGEPSGATREGYLQRLLVPEAAAGRAIRQLFVPAGEAGIEWVGTSAAMPAEWLPATVAAVRQIVEGEPLGEKRGTATLRLLLAGVGAATLLLVGLAVLTALVSAWLRFA